MSRYVAPRLVVGTLAALGVIVVTIVVTLALSAPDTSSSTSSDKTPAAAYEAGYQFMSEDIAQYRNQYDYAEQLETSTTTCVQMMYRLNASGEYGRGGGTELLRGCNDAMRDS